MHAVPEVSAFLDQNGGSSLPSLAPAGTVLVLDTLINPQLKRQVAEYDVSDQRKYMVDLILIQPNGQQVTSLTGKFAFNVRSLILHRGHLVCELRQENSGAEKSIFNFMGP